MPVLDTPYKTAIFMAWKDAEKIANKAEELARISRNTERTLRGIKEVLLNA